MEEEDLINRFLEVVKHLAEDLREESESWVASMVVVRSLGWSVLVDLVAREFRSRVGLKGGVAGFSLGKGFALLRFEEARKRDLVLCRPCVVIGQELALEPQWLGFLLAKGVILLTRIWIYLP